MQTVKRVKGTVALTVVVLLCAVLFSLLSLVPAKAAPGDIVRASTSSSGAQGDDSSFWPSMSSDGRYAAFESLPARTEKGEGVVAAAVPGDISADRFGVVISHLPLYDPAAMDAELDAAAAAGAGWVRSVFAWSDMEPSPGAWNFAGTDMAAQKADERGIKLLGILLASPPWANGGNPWNYPPTNLEAWKNYVRTVVARYGGQVAAWEVWNEQNIHGFWMPDPDPAAYVTLLGATALAAREVDPHVKLVMGGVAGLDPDFLNNCLALGAAEYVDALAYHPYPETLTQDNYTPQEEHTRNIVGFVRWLISRYTTKELEIWLTEFGWTTCAPSPPGVSESTQAAYMLRSFINYAATDVDKVFYYSLRDGLLNEYNYYGLLRNDFTEKPSYRYYGNFMGFFSGATAAPPGAAVFSCGAPGTLEAHVFELPDGSMNIAAWKSDDAADSLTITLSHPGFDMPLLLDMDSGVAAPAPGATRGPEGIITVSGLPVGKDPVVLRFDALGPVHVFSLSPERGPAGQEVTIDGFGFGDEQGGSGVYFGNTRATEYVMWTDTRIICRVPPGLSGEVPVRVVVGGEESRPVPFTVFAITSITPAYGVQNATVSITNLAGTGFIEGATVRIVGTGTTVNATDVNVVSDTQITCKLSLKGAPLGKYDVVVTNPDGQEATLTQGFKVTDACGGGAAVSLSLFGLMMGLMSLAGSEGLRRRLRRKRK